MNEKWTKEQIDTAKKYQTESCDCVNCEKCKLYSKYDDWCIIHKNINYDPVSKNLKNLSIMDSYTKLIQQHEHDADDCICKQTTPPHAGTTRVLDYVLADLKSRAEMGKQKYGHYLETDNGRNALQDAYEEALDMCMYLKQKLLEEEGK